MAIQGGAPYLRAASATVPAAAAAERLAKTRPRNSMMHACRGVAPAGARGLVALALFLAVVRWQRRSRTAQGYAAQWLLRVTQAARIAQLLGHGDGPAGRANFETFRLAHMFENGQESEKLLSLDGPAREIVRSRHRGALLLPRREGRAHRAAHDPQRVPSLSPEQTSNLAQYYEFKLVPGGRVAGRDDRDGRRSSRATACATAHRFWADRHDGAAAASSRLVNEKGEVIEEFAFTDVTYNAKLDKEMVRPSWTSVPVRLAGHAGRSRRLREQRHRLDRATRCRRGFIKISEGFRTLAGKREPCRATRVLRRPRGDQRVRGAVHGHADADRADADRRPCAIFARAAMRIASR